MRLDLFKLRDRDGILNQEGFGFHFDLELGVLLFDEVETLVVGDFLELKEIFDHGEDLLGDYRLAALSRTMLTLKGLS